MFAQPLRSGSELVDISVNFEPELGPMTDIPTAAFDVSGHFISLPNLNPGGSSSHDSLLSSESHVERQCSGNPPCNCTSRVVKQLLSMPLSSGDKNGSFDAQLSQLRHAISISEDCLSCNCTSEEEMSISMSNPYSLVSFFFGLS